MFKIASAYDAPPYPLSWGASCFQQSQFRAFSA